MLSKIKLVEIEIHSFCNRVCVWCPNKFIYRNKNKVNMEIESYKKVLMSLKNNNFNGVISYSRYNEPLSDIQLLKSYIGVTKNILPNIKLVCNTNGDYISKEALNDLFIDELSIMDYDCKGGDYYLNLLNKIDCNIVKIEDNFIYAQFNNIKILCYLNWPQYHQIEDRGGSLKENVFYKNNKMEWKNDKRLRTVPCLEPSKFIGIDYNGSVVPCCHVRSDNTDHEDFVLGNINDQDLVDIFYSDKAVNFRSIMSSEQFNLYNRCCRSCQKEPGRYTRNDAGIEYKR